ncbi:MAG TPA: ornithine carbamoyltransferase, partial [Syntrophus sp. (in: bacteria)]|nr:ornithine carbamoyltransferase [Syntrophus sp. (in: bacteria)]
ALACPEGYRPDRRILSRALKNSNADILLTDRPEEAVKGADIVYTDVWASMGQEHEQEERVDRFQGYQVNEKLLKHARKDALVMHCLPA